MYLQGLIQVAAALIKQELQIERSVRRLDDFCLDKLERVSTTRHRFCGVDLEDFLALLENEPTLPALRCRVSGLTALVTRSCHHSDRHLSRDRTFRGR